MQHSEFELLVKRLTSLPKETEWVEFKVNYVNHHEIGEYISALSNSACLHDIDHGYLVFGIEDTTHKVCGTKFKPKTTKQGNEELENWLCRLLEPKIDFQIVEDVIDGKKIVVFCIQPTVNTPVRFSGEAYIRVGSYKKKLKDHPEKERQIWSKGIETDFTAEICENASIADLDINAIKQAREKYRMKHLGQEKKLNHGMMLHF